MPTNGQLRTAPILAPQLYWEDRARRYAGVGEGLAAVCSYGMPEFYNRAIDLTQRLALRPWLRNLNGKRVMDVGCGIGRWTRWMALQGAQVTGVDLSFTMTLEARRRTALAGLAEGCRFLTQDLSELDTGSQYELILGVTVLQHILDPLRLRTAVSRLRDHLLREGRIVLIEAAPTRSNSRCDSAVFQARDLTFYQDLFSSSGLEVAALTGVDPVSLKTRYLPYYGMLPKPLAVAGLGVVTGLSFPVDALLGRRCVDRSWHKVFVLRHKAEG